jgi:deoxyribonuclease-4
LSSHPVIRVAVSSQSLPRVGLHVSIAGGLVKAVEQARQLGCETMQIFSKSPRGWAARPLDPADAEAARDLRRRLRIGPFAVHASYLINLASPDPVLYQRSMDALQEELTRCTMMEADYLVVHVGCTREGQRDGVERVSAALRRVLDRTWTGSGVRLLLENTAGERGEVGADFGELGEILHQAGPERVGICLDTCHTFAAGYDLTTPAAVRTLVHTLQGSVGLSAVKLIHANDCRQGLGCRVDRHQHIGEGGIGRAGFQALLSHPELRTIPLVLETPKTSPADDPRNLWVIRMLARASRRSRAAMVPVTKRTPKRPAKRRR